MGDCQCVREAVTEVETCRMAPLSVQTKSLPSGERLILIYGYEIDLGFGNEQVKVADTVGTEPRLHDHGSFDERNYRHGASRGSLNSFVECFSLRLVLKNRNQRRCVYDHQRGNPRSSYPKMASGERSSRIGRDPQWTAISSSSRARFLPPRSRRILSNRS